MHEEVGMSIHRCYLNLAAMYYGYELEIIWLRASLSCQLLWQGFFRSPEIGQTSLLCA